MPKNLATDFELRGLGYQPLDLAWLDRTHDVPPHGACRDFTVLGEIPDCSGLYAFTVEKEDRLEVRYVGMTSHLWMVTKGRLPDGRARGGQRYGRPRHAGVTRQRVNAVLAAEQSGGGRVRQWVLPLGYATPLLRDAEEIAIRRWDLRVSGLNRG